MTRDDNPVAFNVTAMVDVVLCLTLFFIAAPHVRDRGGAIDAWLPSDHH